MFSGTRIKSGEFSGGHPFVRFGRGKEPLVILPPMHDALFSVREFPWFFELLFREFSRDYTVTLVSRKRKLPVGLSTHDMAGEYARVLQHETGPACVMGVSLGGLIAQHLAADHPKLVKKLAVVAAAYKMGPLGLQIARRWIPWARAHKWNEIYEETMAITYTRGHKGLRYKLMKAFLKRLLIPRIHDPSDFIIAGQAGMLHDSWEALPRIEMPVLIIGGTADKFFPEPLFHEMAARIRESRLLIIPGAAHGVYEEHRRRVVATIRDFYENLAVVKSSFPLPQTFAGRFFE